MRFDGVVGNRAEKLFVLAMGLAAGALVVVGAKWALLLTLAGLVVAVGIHAPSSLVVLMWLAMLLDRAGVTGAKLDDFPVTASKLSVVGSLGLWAAHATLKQVPLVRWHPVFFGFFGMLSTTAICVAYSNSMKEGKFILFGLAMMLVMVGLVYAILAAARLQPLYRTFASIFLVALTFSVLAPGGAGESGRATGTMGDPNEWATLVLLTTPFLLGGLADDEGYFPAALRLGLLLLSPLAVLASGSRTALVVGFLVTIPCLFLVRGRRGELALCGAFALAAAPIWLSRDTSIVRLKSLWATFRGDSVVRDDSFAERSELFRQGVDLFRDHWLLGAGPGNFERATGFIGQSGKFRPAHNTYLEIASEQGLLGLTSTAAFLVLVAFTLRRGLAPHLARQARRRALGIAIGLTALALMAATLGLLTFSAGYLVLGFGLAVVHQGENGLVR